MDRIRQAADVLREADVRDGRLDLPVGNWWTRRFLEGRGWSPTAESPSDALAGPPLERWTRTL